MNLYLDMSGSIPETRPLIASGSTLLEDNPLVSGNLSDGEFVENISTLDIDMTGPKYIRYASSSYDCQLYSIELEIWRYEQEDPNYQWGRHTISIPFSAPGTTKSTAAYTVDVSSLLFEWRGIAPWTDDDRSLKSPNRLTMLLTYKGISGDIKGGYISFRQDLTITAYKYITPSMSAFTMNRALSDGTISNQGEYGRYDITSNLAAIQASSEPSFIKSAAALTISFTRGSTDYSHAAASGGTGLLQSGGSALQLGNEETFTVTATLTDGINTVSMSALLSANFAIFNANAAKTGIAFGKYATRSGFDCNMDAIFRKSVTLGVSPWEILWVNQNPSSSFASGDRTMSRAVSEGEMVVCFYKHLSTADNPNMQAFGWVGVVDVRLQIGIATSNNIGTRVLTFTANSNKFNASNCTYNNQTTNSDCVPIFVAALKNMDITSAMISAWVAPT